MIPKDMPRIDQDYWYNLAEDAILTNESTAVDYVYDRMREHYSDLEDDAMDYYQLARYFVRSCEL